MEYILMLAVCDPVAHLRTGMATKLPTTTQLNKNANAADLTTISHCPLTTIGFKTFVSGDANAGTAFTNLN